MTDEAPSLLSSPTADNSPAVDTCCRRGFGPAVSFISSQSDCQNQAQTVTTREGAMLAFARSLRRATFVSISEFFLLIVDENRKQFTVEGPMTDEEPWHRAVAAARDKGRDCPMLQYRREVACR